MVACRLCGNNADVPMLKDEIWAQVSPPEEFEAYITEKRLLGVRGRIHDFLCIKCVESRLGRTIYTEDLNSSVWSECVRNIVQRELARAQALY